MSFAARLASTSTPSAHFRPYLVHPPPKHLITKRFSNTSQHANSSLLFKQLQAVTIAPWSLCSHYSLDLIVWLAAQLFCLSFYFSHFSFHNKTYILFTHSALLLILISYRGFIAFLAPSALPPPATWASLSGGWWKPSTATPSDSWQAASVGGSSSTLLLGTLLLGTLVPAAHTSTGSRSPEK